MASRSVVVIRGGKKPDVVDLSSRTDDACGVIEVLLIPIWATALVPDSITMLKTAIHLALVFLFDIPDSILMFFIIAADYLQLINKYYYHPNLLPLKRQGNTTFKDPAKIYRQLLVNSLITSNSLK